MRTFCISSSMHFSTPPMYSVKAGLRDCQTSTLYFCALLKRPANETKSRRERSTGMTRSDLEGAYLVGRPDECTGRCGRRPRLRRGIVSACKEGVKVETAETSVRKSCMSFTVSAEGAQVSV
jgi:hypothetical protein